MTSSVTLGDVGIDDEFKQSDCRGKQPNQMPHLTGPHYWFRATSSPCS